MHEAHDALMCIGQKKYVNDTNRIKLTNNHYLKNSNEMCDLFNDLPEALRKASIESKNFKIELELAESIENTLTEGFVSMFQALVDGTQFDSSIGKTPIEFMLGARKVIPGSEEGIQLLNVGAKAKLIIPPTLGWGSRGAGNVIPPNSTVIFEVELIEILPEHHDHDHSDPNHTH